MAGLLYGAYFLPNAKPFDSHDRNNRNELAPFSIPSRALLHRAYQMDRSRQRLGISASSPAIWRRAIVVGCAAFLLMWHFLPRSSACRAVTISFPVSTMQSAGGDESAVERSLRRYFIAVGSPQLKKLTELAAETYETSVSRLPLEYYAEQWRVTAAEYYYERELQRERAAAGIGREIPGVSAGKTDQELTGRSAAIAPVNVRSISDDSAGSQTFDSSHWQREARRAKARQEALLASLPAPDSIRRPTIVFGELIPDRPKTTWVIGAAAAALLSALGVGWLQYRTLLPVPPVACRPSMQLHLPADWFWQSRPFGQRVIRGLSMVAWLSILGCSVAAWLG